VSKKTPVSHIVVPDTQVKPGVPTDHLEHAGKYIADRKPDTVIMLGDWADMHSLSSYDKGKKSFEGRRYKQDVASSGEAMERFLAGLKGMRKRPRLVMLKGNHEQRIDRAIEDDAKLEGTIGYEDLGFSAAGWECYPFLQPVTIDGVTYCHFFPRSASGSISQTTRGAPNAKAQLVREGGSCVAGHQQGLDMACLPLRGRLQWGIIAGSFYQHDEAYLSPQGNAHWRGLVVLHEVNEGYFDPMTVSLGFLKRRYGT
jgi:hypothetical protein